jgi:hypothetical protein
VVRVDWLKFDLYLSSIAGLNFGGGAFGNFYREDGQFHL